MPLAGLVYGRDYSSVQGDVDWAAEAKAGVRFAYLKCGNGNNGVDPTFARNVAECRAAGIAPGAYQFFFDIQKDALHLTRDPAAQAQAHFAASDGVGTHPGELPPAGDLEWPPPEEWVKWGVDPRSAKENALTYLVTLRNLFGVSPLAYTYRYWWKSLANETTNYRFTPYGLWLASVNGPPPDLVTPLWPWAGWTMYQSGASGRCNLVGGGSCPVDEDWIADEATFARLLARP